MLAADDCVRCRVEALSVDRVEPPPSFSFILRDSIKLYSCFPGLLNVARRAVVSATRPNHRRTIKPVCPQRMRRCKCFVAKILASCSVDLYVGAELLPHGSDCATFMTSRATAL